MPCKTILPAKIKSSDFSIGHIGMVQSYFYWLKILSVDSNERLFLLSYLGVNGKWPTQPCRVSPFQCLLLFQFYMISGMESNLGPWFFQGFCKYIFFYLRHTGIKN